jgi:hypothetical protein
MSDMTVRDSDVRFRGQSGLPLRRGKCLQVTQLGQLNNRHVALAKPLLSPIQVLVRPVTMSSPDPSFGGGHAAARVH